MGQTNFWAIHFEKSHFGTLYALVQLLLFGYCRKVPIILSSRLASTFIASLVLLGLTTFLSPNAAKAGIYTLTPMGTLGGTDSIGLGVNNSGQVAGNYTSADGSLRAFVTGSIGTAPTDLGDLGSNYGRAYGINTTGQMTGFSKSTAGDYHAYFSGASGGMLMDLGTLGGHNSFGHGANDSGQVAGHSFLADNTTIHAFILKTTRCRAQIPASGME